MYVISCFTKKKKLLLKTSKKQMWYINYELGLYIFLFGKIVSHQVNTYIKFFYMISVAVGKYKKN